MNQAIKDRPADMTIAMHLCRGNFQSNWVAEGAYDPVADAIFNQTDVDIYFMEYDSERAGGFEPLRFVRNGQIIVLGLVTTKEAELEPKDKIKRRIDEAARYVSIHNLCLSPQCGFSSTYHGNNLTLDDQKRKLELIIAVADEVWGTA